MAKLKKRTKQLIKILKIRFGLFFLISFLFLFFFAYYIICFCGIHINTQTHLINDTVISFSLSIVYSFVQCLIPSIFRIAALRAKNKDKEYLYKFSNIIQAIFT